MLDLGGIFTLLLVMLGPFKLVGPFTRLTQDLDEGRVRQIAFRAFLLAVAAVLLGGLGGRVVMQTWGVSVPVLVLSGGIVFAIVGLRVVLEQYHPVEAAPAPLPHSLTAAAMRVVFPTIVTPYGIAAMIVVLANSREGTRSASILGMAIGVLVLDLLAMLHARRVMGGISAALLQVVGAVLGVVQVALAIELVLHGLRGLGELHG